MTHLGGLQGRTPVRLSVRLLHAEEPWTRPAGLAGGRPARLTGGTQRGLCDHSVHIARTGPRSQAARPPYRGENSRRSFPTDSATGWSSPDFSASQEPGPGVPPTRSHPPGHTRAVSVPPTRSHPGCISTSKVHEDAAITADVRAKHPFGKQPKPQQPEWMWHSQSPRQPGPHTPELPPPRPRLHTSILRPCWALRSVTHTLPSKVVVGSLGLSMYVFLPMVGTGLTRP